MSTKNLARTVIEGGRARRNKWERWHSNRAHRRSVRIFVGNEPPEDAAAPRRKRVPRDFDDKLGPALRWLDQQVGKRWDDVRSELFTRFDARTLAGRHVLYGHLLEWVSAGLSDRRYARLAIDVEGRLERLPPRRQTHHVTAHRMNEQALDAIAGGRRVRALGAKLFWLVPVPRPWKDERQAKANRTKAARRADELIRYRQDRALSHAEVERFAALCSSAREGLLR